jgi:hypothetical protein
MWVKHVLIQLYIHWAFIILFIKIKPFPSQVQHCMLDQALQEENYNICFLHRQMELFQSVYNDINCSICLKNKSDVFVVWNTSLKIPKR